MRQSSGRWFFGSQAWLALRKEKMRSLARDLLFVAARAAEGGVEAVLVERLLQRLGLHHLGVQRRAGVERIDAALHAVLVDVHEQIEAEPLAPSRRGTRSSRGTSRSCRRAAAETAAWTG